MKIVAPKPFTYHYTWQRAGTIAWRYPKVFKKFSRLVSDKKDKVPLRIPT